MQSVPATIGGGTTGVGGGHTVVMAPGVTITRVVGGNVQYPAEVADAVSRKLAATQELQRKDTEIEIEPMMAGYERALGGLLPAFRHVGDGRLHDRRDHLRRRLRLRLGQAGVGLGPGRS